MRGAGSDLDVDKSRAPLPIKGTILEKETPANTRSFELSLELLLEILLVLVPLGRDVIGLPPNVPLGVGIWSVAAFIAVRMFWIWERTATLSILAKVSVSALFIAVVAVGTWESAWEALLLQHPISKEAQDIPFLPTHLMPIIPSWILPPKPSVVIQKPDIGMEFVGPGDVGFRMCNLSSALLRDPKYTLMLFDIDGPRKTFPNGTSVPDPLPIPTAIDHDFLRPGQKYLYRPIVSTFPAVQSIVKSGDRIFGLGIVSCPYCVKDRAYWVYFIAGGGGWYSEMQNYKDSIQIPLPSLLADLQGTLDKLVPAKKRITIAAP